MRHGSYKSWDSYLDNLDTQSECSNLVNHSHDDCSGSKQDCPCLNPLALGVTATFETGEVNSMNELKHNPKDKHGRTLRKSLTVTLENRNSENLSKIHGFLLFPVKIRCFRGSTSPTLKNHHGFPLFQPLRSAYNPRLSRYFTKHVQK